MNNEIHNKVEKSVAILRNLYPEEEVGIANFNQHKI